jgi:DNA mismatch repair protein MutS2
VRAAIERSLDEKGEVKDDASPLLKRLREELVRHAREVEARVQRIANSPALRSVLADGSAGQVQLRGGRPTLAVKAKSRGRVPGIVHDASQSGETLFVEPEEVVELGNRLAAARADAKREESRVLVELTRSVLGRYDELDDLSARLARLELALLGAAWARECGGRPARLSGDEGAGVGLVMRGFRHPLLADQRAAGRIDAVVPVDLRLGDDFDMLLLTGPNTGGKTLALKSAGLVALLTRLGLPVPCDEGTTVPLYSGIAADIGDEQEIQQSLSTFSSHLKRIQAGLARADARTLFLLDELGGGSDPAEGAALGAAILDELVRRGVPTLVSTHLGQLKEFAYRTPRVENGSVEFDLETLAPLYRVMIGLPGESRALAIARRFGFPDALVARAEGRVERRPEDAAELVRDLRGARVDAERMRASAGERLVELEGRLTAHEAERDELRRRGAALEAEAQRAVEERVALARPALQRARAILDQLSRAQREPLEEVLDELADALGGATLSERRTEFVLGLKRGDHVWLPKYKKRVQVVRVRKDKREVVVRLLRQELTVSFDDVTFYESL